jgi:hypothetical protein
MPYNGGDSPPSEQGRRFRPPRIIAAPSPRQQRPRPRRIEASSLQVTPYCANVHLAAYGVANAQIVG